MPYSGRIPGTFGNGASSGDEAPAISFSTPSNQMVDYPKPSVPGRIPGTYGNGANNGDAAPAQSFPARVFDNGQAGDGPSFEGNGQHVGGW